MDIDILRAIIQSHEEVMKDVEGKFDQCVVGQKFPPMDCTILTALTRSFTDLISHKVSPEAYQRYSVRIQVIEILREWIRPPRLLDCSRSFSNGDRVLEFTAKILRVYLSNELLYQDDGNIDILVTMAKALICLIPKNKNFVQDLEKLLNRIGELEQTEESGRLCIHAFEEKDTLGLDASTVENLYLSQRLKLIEKPLTDDLIANLKDSTLQHFKNSPNIEKLLEISIESERIFHISCSIFKEIFVHSEYSPRVLDYIKRYIELLESLCKQRNKNILDLYPLRSQPIVILLSILPELHTPYSQEYSINCLEKLHSTSPEETLILLTHFPVWLEFVSTRLEENSRPVDSHSLKSIIIDDE